MLWNENECDENLKANIPITDRDRSKITGECGIFQLLGKHERK